MTTWVVNTSPLIFLARLGRLELLRKGADLVCAPEAVLDEVGARPDEAAHAVEQAVGSCLSIRPVGSRAVVEFLQADLDLGEAEVIALAKELNADLVVMDDLDGRRFARRVGFDIIGTLGLLLAARLRGEIPSVRDEIQRLQDHGFRAASALVEAVLREAGE